MHPNARLNEILSSPAQVAAPRIVRKEKFAEIHGRSALVAIGSTLDALAEPSTAAIFAALAPFIDDVEWIGAYLLDLVEGCAQDPLFCPPVSGGHDPLSNDAGVANITIVDHPLAMISIHGWSSRLTYDHRPAVVQVGGMSSLLRAVGPATAHFRRWSCAGFSESADIAALTIREEPDICIGADPVAIDGRTQAIAFRRSDGPFVALQIRSKRECAGRVLEFDADSGTLSNILPTRPAEARIPLMFAILRQNRMLTATIVTPYLAHPSYAVRWQAMRELLALGGVGAKTQLQNFLVREPNPTVQRAGARAMALLDSLGA